ncbi:MULTISPECIES: GtrA family protein [unclassified Mesorhizobium]|uniref:GtrA family protein n=1 Tax=unclassified Mesorhizobium TaxID=325217 RepID=UPI001679D140|nr:MULTISPECIES: GtrA family protein [unclassified Mesorhizobium]
MSVTSAKIARFIFAGGIGFVTDGAVFFGFVYGFGGSIIAARVLASLVAMTVTWALNRSMTFIDGRMQNRTAEYGKYLIASFVGMGANLIVLNEASKIDANFYHVPAYLLGAIAGLVVNYALYDRIVFNGHRSLG